MRIDLEVNGLAYSLNVPPLRRLLDILREDLGLTGTKEGCGEGECGACAVHLDGGLVNACLVPALQLHGSRIVTIEGIGDAENPDPVQHAFVQEGAVQCGFCIPGMIMAARALLERSPNPNREQIREALAGNLCRCTGYERIVAAVEKAAGARPVRSDLIATGSRRGARSPVTLMEALEILEERRAEVTIVAGATDLMTGAKLGVIQPRIFLDVSGIESLHGISRVDGMIEIGSCTTFEVIAQNPALASHLPALTRAGQLFGAPAIRNRATIGGNLLSASPAADAPPVLMALDATLVLASAGGSREVSVSSLFAGYRRTVRRDDELLLKIRIPIPADGSRQVFYKVGTRRAQSISKISIAGLVRVRPDGTLSQVRLAAGSVAPTPILLRQVARFLEGARLDPNVIIQAEEIAAAEVSPIDDVRSTEHYRRLVAGRLVGRFLREIMVG